MTIYLPCTQMMMTRYNINRQEDEQAGCDGDDDDAKEEHKGYLLDDDLKEFIVAAALFSLANLVGKKLTRV